MIRDEDRRRSSALVGQLRRAKSGVEGRSHVIQESSDRRQGAEVRQTGLGNPEKRSLDEAEQCSTVSPFHTGTLSDRLLFLCNTLNVSSAAMSLAQQTAYQQHLQGQQVQLHTLDRQALEESLRRSITLVFWYKV